MKKTDGQLFPKELHYIQINVTIHADCDFTGFFSIVVPRQYKNRLFQNYSKKTLCITFVIFMFLNTVLNPFCQHLINDVTIPVH